MGKDNLSLNLESGHDFYSVIRITFQNISFHSRECINYANRYAESNVSKHKY